MNLFVDLLLSVVLFKFSSSGFCLGVASFLSSPSSSVDCCAGVSPPPPPPPPQHAEQNSEGKRLTMLIMRTAMYNNTRARSKEKKSQSGWSARLSMLVSSHMRMIAYAYVALTKLLYVLSISVGVERNRTGGFCPLASTHPKIFLTLTSLMACASHFFISSTFVLSVVPLLLVVLLSLTSGAHALAAPFPFQVHNTNATLREFFFSFLLYHISFYIIFFPNFCLCWFFFAPMPWLGILRMRCRHDPELISYPPSSLSPILSNIFTVYSFVVYVISVLSDNYIEHGCGTIHETSLTPFFLCVFLPVNVHSLNAPLGLAIHPVTKNFYTCQVSIRHH